MTIEECSVHFRGHTLHRLILRTDSPPVGTLIFFHGQGDFIDRYPELLEMFVEKGWTCVLTDLPGHGQSSGKRGHIPRLSFVDALFEKTLTGFPGRYAIAGHSMGGMLAMHEFLKSPKNFEFVWLSSPLLAPARQGHPILKFALPVIARLFPWITCSTGVKAEDCRPEDADELRVDSDQPSLFHSKISLSWAQDLIKLSQELDSLMLALPTDVPILFTQGSVDSVCPAEILRKRLKKQPQSKIIYREIEGGLHEPFTGEKTEEFKENMRKDLNRLI